MFKTVTWCQKNEMCQIDIGHTITGTLHGIQMEGLAIKICHFKNVFKEIDVASIDVVS